MQKIFLFFISHLMLTASLVYALPPKETLKASKGITKTLYHNSSFSQKREIRNIQYQFHQDLRKQTEKYRNTNDKLHLLNKFNNFDSKETNNKTIREIYNQIVN